MGGGAGEVSAFLKNWKTWPLTRGGEVSRGGSWFVFVGNQFQIPYDNNLFELAIFWSFF